MTNDSVSITKTPMIGVKLMIERYKKILAQKVKVSAKISKCHKRNSYIFLHNHDCKTLFIGIYIDLLSFKFNLLSARYYYAYHQISKFEIYTSLGTAKYIVLPNIIIVVSDNILRICIYERLLISKKFTVPIHTLSAYSILVYKLKVY